MCVAIMNAKEHTCNSRSILACSGRPQTVHGQTTAGRHALYVEAVGYREWDVEQWEPCCTSDRRCLKLTAASGEGNVRWWSGVLLEVCALTG